MKIPLASDLRALGRPQGAFQEGAPPLGRAVFRMALVWMPLGLVHGAFSVLRWLRGYEALRRGSMPGGLLAWLGVDAGDLQALVAGLPVPPAFGRIWPWLLLAVPLGILGTWLHDAVWDHACLWLLGGLKGRRGFRTSLVAEAEALRIAALGTLASLLGFLPVLGPFLALPLLLLEAYLWLFRGFALAARHGCESWRGIAATALHAALLGCCALGLMSLVLVLARMGP
jgi:hypothetical protein